jgi:hypothetical protein
MRSPTVSAEAKRILEIAAYTQTCQAAHHDFQGVFSEQYHMIVTRTVEASVISASG